MIARIGGTRFASDSTSGLQILRFSPDQKWLVGLGDDVYIWDAESGRLAGKLALPANAAGTILVSPDSKTLAVGLKDKILFVDLATRKTLREVAAEGNDGGSLFAWSADGKQIQLLRKGYWHVRDVETWREVRSEHSGWYSLATDALATATQDRRVDRRKPEPPAKLEVIRFTSGKSLWEKTWPDRAVDRYFFSPDGKLLYAAFHSHEAPDVQWWSLFDAPTGAEVCRFKSSSWNLAFSPGDTTVVEWDGDCRAIRVADGKVLVTGLLTSGWRCFSPDGKLLASVDGSGRAVLIDTATWHVVGDPGPEPEGEPVILSGGRRMATRTSRSAEILIWDGQTGRLLDSLPASGTEAIRRGPDAHALLASRRGGIDVWDIDQRKVIRRIPLSETAATDQFCVSEDGGTAAVGDGEAIRVFSVASGKEMSHIDIKPYETTNHGVTPDTRLSADGTLITARYKLSSDKDDNGLFFIAVRDVESGQELYRGASHGIIGGEQGFYGFVRGGYFLTTGGENAPKGTGFVLVREVATAGAVVQTITCPIGGYFDYPPDFPFFLTQSMQGVLRCWSLDSGRVLYEGKPREFHVGTTLFPGGRRFILAWSGERFVIGETPKEVVDLATHLNFRNLAEKEFSGLWGRLLGEPKDAYEAAAELASGGDSTVEFLKRRWKLPAFDESAARRLVETLIADGDTKRDGAIAALERMGPRALSILRDALSRASKGSGPAPEIESLIARLSGSAISDADELRRVRAIDVLERIGTKEAADFLSVVAKGPSLARETRYAVGSLRRLALRRDGGN